MSLILLFIAGHHRTNNPLESWHNVFSQDLPAHEVLNKFITLVKQEQTLTEVMINQLVRDGENRVRDKSERKNSLLKTTVKKYKTGNFEHYFDVISIILDNLK